MWFRWVVTSVFLPLLPFLLTVVFRWFAVTPMPNAPPLLWNSELPFFTLVMGITNVQIYWSLKGLETTEKGVYSYLEKAMTVAAIVGGVSVLLLAIFYWDQHVAKMVTDPQRGRIETTQALLAAGQLVLGIGMRYAEDRFTPKPTPAKP